MRFAVARAFAITLLLPTAVRGQSGRPWTPGERVLITSFNELSAVTTDLRRVFAASPNGIEIYDFASRRWQMPTTEVDGYPARETPVALTYDRTTDALLLATNAGTLYSYTLAFSRWERRAALFNNPVREMFVAQTGDPGALYINGAHGWSRIPPGSFMEQPLGSAQLPPDVARQANTSPLRRAQSDPYLAAASATLTQDAQLRHWPISGVALGDQLGQYWIATAGGNLFFYDGRFSRAENRTYGLLTRGTGAIGGDAGTLWFGGDGRGMRTGVTSADPALQTWRSYEPQYDNAPAGFVYEIIVSGAATWFAATDGVFRFDAKTRRWARFTEADGIPELPAVTLAAAQDGGVLVGARGGIVQLNADGRAASAVALAGVSVNRILVHGDTVWLATESGLWTLASGVFNAQEQTPLRGSVLDVVAAPDALVALAGDALYRRDSTGVWTGPLRAAAPGRLGRLHRLAFDEGQLWVAGEGGVARLDESRALWTYYQVGTDIPEGPVVSMKPDGAWIWLATPAGALHLKWRR